MNKLICALALTAGVALAVPAQAAYKLDITTSYGFSYGGPPGNSLGGGSPSPDTGFLSFTNSGPTTFTGTLGYTAVEGGGSTDISSSASGLTLAPGATDYFAIGNESSNVGGFGPNGVGIYAIGMFGGTSVNLSVNDADVHSGVARTSPCDGATSDSFVLQGGSPTGCDNGDTFETTQSFGHFTFRGGGGAVPEPATWAMMLLGFGAIGGSIRFRRRSPFATA